MLNPPQESRRSENTDRNRRSQALMDSRSISLGQHKLTDALREILPAKQAKFFCDFARLETVTGLIGKYASRTGLVLDLGCGMFALDYWLEKRGHVNIIGIDRNPQVKGVFEKLRAESLLNNTRFIEGNLADCQTATGASVDLVILNDALFYRDANIGALLSPIYQILIPGGYFIFDIWDAHFPEKTRPFYQLLFPQYRNYKRFAVSEVESDLRQSGFKVIEQIPRFSNKPIPRLIEQLLWKTFRASNSRYFVARKVSA
jgi:SAM-dependent methyltransferase